MYVAFKKNKTGYIQNKIHELIYVFDIGDKEINTTSPSEKKNDWLIHVRNFSFMKTGRCSIEY